MRFRLPEAVATAVLTLACTALPASAQVAAIAAGQTVSGRLDTSDAALTDDSYYDLYEYRGQPGETIVVTMRSSDFDAYLQGGPPSGADLTAEDSDDDSGGGTDAQLTVTLAADGVYRIRANSLGAGQTGAYTLSVRSDRPASGGIAVVSAGQTVSGRLDTTDPQLGDDSHYDLYEYRGQAGETIVVTMRSSDFDTYLQGGPASGDELSAEDSDDDGAGGTDSRITATVGSSGVYRIRANSLGGGQTGAYSLSVQSDRASTGAGASVIAAGQTVAGRLDTSDPRLSDDSYYDVYYYDGSPGEEVLITLTSGDFDTFLRWGRGEGAAFELELSDDDGAGSTNSQLEVTVEASGRYVIQANSYAGNQTGAYTLSVESVGGAAAGFPSIGLGRTVTSELDGADPVRSDDTPYELYVYRGTAGDRVMVTLRSDDFDTYLQAGRLVGDRFESDADDDDSGGGTDSQLLATVPSSGSLAILANAYAAGGSGRFSLSVESLSGAGGPLSGGPTAPAGRPTVAPGTSVQGILEIDDGMLPDSSFFDPYVYAGSPGDRLRITLGSSDFDAYLGWGRMSDAGFTGEVYDDDSGGGSDALLDVTVDGTGTFTIMANSYFPGQTGAYTLSVERLEAPAPSTPSAPAAGSAGKWLYEYAEPLTAVHRSLSQRVKQYGALEEIVAALQTRYTLPRPIELRFDTCDMVNAFYTPSETAIVFCYELLEFLASSFVADGLWTDAQRADVFGAVEFIMMHEVGHALVDVLDLPITGREEDVADQLAVYVLVRGGEKGAQAALSGVSAIQPASIEFDETQLADEHSLGPVRLFNVLCWIYGSDPAKYGGIVSNGMLPEDRAVRCTGEWDRMSKAWQRLLAAYRP